MKLYIIIVLVAASVCLLTYAATKEWSLEGGVNIPQLVADGSGGCAFYWYTTNAGTEIVWVDKKGVTKYRKVIMSPSQYPILRCGKKELVYLTTSTSSLPYAVQVSSKGVEQEIKVPHTVMYPPYSMGVGSYQVPSDKKGFFVMEYATNGPVFKLVRYSYK
jgi:hypothetical protein